MSASATVEYAKYVTSEHVARAAERLRPHLPATPIMTSSHLDALAGRSLFFKCEHLQKTGSFKARGAMNALLMRAGAASGVLTHSSGNHGQAVAWAARQLGLPCCVVVPEGTAPVKVEAIVAYGAEVVECRPNLEDRRRVCAQLARERDFHAVEPFDDYDVIAGQGTIAMEMLQQVPNLDAVLVPVSGGGMASGMAIALQDSGARVVCVEPEGKRLRDSLTARQRLWREPNSLLPTVADAIRLSSVGCLTFPILCDLVGENVTTVSDPGMIDGMKLAFKFLKQVVEPASGAAVHAGVRMSLPIDARRVGVVLCGGNVDPDALPWVSFAT